jgi:putative two-component system response regulator
MIDRLSGRVPARIMIVDDEPNNLKLLDLLLRSAGHQDLCLLSDPRHVVEQYLRRPPALILLDLNMPHLDGFAVLEALKALNDPLLPPVVILTAQSHRDTMFRAFAAGARDYITKPFDTVEVVVRVRNLLDAHLAHRLLHDQKAILEEVVRGRTQQLRDTQLSIIRRLGRAAEFRDSETGSHIIRMSRYCTLIAEAIGWSEGDCELLLNASPMHDVGKIGIPDHILLKPGRLTFDEFEIMKTHTTIGAQIIGDDSTNPVLCLAQEVALTHHEKWDGTGYPAGLTGAAIPEVGRIVAIADVFDALTSPRPYKAAWSVEDSTALVVAESGRQFDPAMVEAFLRVLPEILEIRGQFADPA